MREKIGNNERRERKLFRRAIAMGLLLCLGAQTLAGCNSESKAGEPPVTGEQVAELAVSLGSRIVALGQDIRNGVRTDGATTTYNFYTDPFPGFKDRASWRVQKQEGNSLYYAKILAANNLSTDPTTPPDPTRTQRIILGRAALTAHNKPDVTEEWFLFAPMGQRDGFTIVGNQTSCALEYPACQTAYVTGTNGLAGHEEGLMKRSLSEQTDRANRLLQNLTG